jgi:uncharacterized OsmC-like protein
MAISAEKDGLDMRGATADVTKEMAANPRRVARLTVHIRMPGRIGEKDREKLETIARTCPVAKSLAEALEAPMEFQWNLF